MNRQWHLIMLGCALLFLAPAYFAGVRQSVAIESTCAAAIIPSPETSATASPTPTARSSEVKRPNPVRRLFSWVAHLFRKPVPVISDPPIVSVTASAAVISICPTVISTEPNCSVDRQVELSATTNDADEDKQVLFTWTVTAGRLSGEGRKVTWDLSSVPEGSYTATVEVNAGNQLTASASTTVTVALCGACDPPPPPCPFVSVSCPSNIEPKQPITFETIVTGGAPAMTPSYTWKVSAGKITSGQGTLKITVDVSDGAPVTATVSIGGADPSCTGMIASCTVGITSPSNND
jgi:hypothetical protein